MSTSPPALTGPLAELANRRRRRPVIESLAAECLADVLSHRPLLATWAATPPTDLDAWVEAAWAAGQALVGLTAGGRSAADYLAELRDTPGGSASADTRAAGYGCCELLAAGAAGNRARLAAVRSHLAEYPLDPGELARQADQLCRRLDGRVMRDRTAPYARRHRERTGLPTFGAAGPAWAWRDTPDRLSDDAVRAMRLWEAAEGQESYDWPELACWWPPKSEGCGTAGQEPNVGQSDVGYSASDHEGAAGAAEGSDGENLDQRERDVLAHMAVNRGKTLTVSEVAGGMSRDRKTVTDPLARLAELRLLDVTVGRPVKYSANDAGRVKARELGLIR